MRARNEIHTESYCKVIRIEALTLLDMIRRSILPAVSTYCDQLSQTILHKRSACATASCRAEEGILAKLSRNSSALYSESEKLEKLLSQCEDKEPSYELAFFYHDKVMGSMEKLRASINELESLTSKECWPYPTYSEILFSV